MHVCVGGGGGLQSACMGMKEQGRVEARETLTTEQWASKVNLASRIKHWGWQKNLASALPCDTAHQNASHISTHTLTHKSTHTHKYTHTNMHKHPDILHTHPDTIQTDAPHIHVLPHYINTPEHTDIMHDTLHTYACTDTHTHPDIHNKPVHRISDT